MLESQFPTYARMLYQGMVFRLPEDLPLDAIPEREHLRQVGLKSNVTIQLMATGTILHDLGLVEVMRSECTGFSSQERIAVVDSNADNYLD
jgi:hypothetical protein